MARLLIKLEAVRDRSGGSRIKKGRTVIQTITHWYSNTKCRTSSGDVWYVKPIVNKREGQEDVTHVAVK